MCLTDAHQRTCTGDCDILKTSGWEHEPQLHTHLVEPPKRATVNEGLARTPAQVERQDGTHAGKEDLHTPGDTQQGGGHVSAMHDPQQLFLTVALYGSHLVTMCGQPLHENESATSNNKESVTSTTQLPAAAPAPRMPAAPAWHAMLICCPLGFL